MGPLPTIQNTLGIIFVANHSDQEGIVHNLALLEQADISSQLRKQSFLSPTSNVDSIRWLIRCELLRRIGTDLFG